MSTARGILRVRLGEAFGFNEKQTRFLCLGEVHSPRGRQITNRSCKREGCTMCDSKSALSLKYTQSEPGPQKQHRERHGSMKEPGPLWELKNMVLLEGRAGKGGQEMGLERRRARSERGA